MNSARFIRQSQRCFISHSYRAKSKASPSCKIQFRILLSFWELQIFSSVLIHAYFCIFSFNLCKKKKPQKPQECVCIPLNLLDFGTDLNDCRRGLQLGTFYAYLEGSFTLLEQWSLRDLGKAAHNAPKLGMK